MSPTCLSGLGPHDRLSLLPSQVRCHQNIAGMLLASGLPISSGASPFDFLQSFRCAPTSSLTPTFPSSPVLPCPASLGGKLASRDLQSLRLPTGVKPLPAPSASFYLPPLCTFVSVNRPRPAPPPPGVVCVAGRTGRGFKEVEEKAPHQGSWDGSAEAVKILLHVKKKKILLHVKGERQRLQRRHRWN